METNQSIKETTYQENLEAVLTTSEKASLGIRLSSAFLAAGILIISYTIEYLDHGQAEAAGFLNGIAALLAGIPVMWNAWKGIKSPDLHSVADLLVSVALLAAWVAGDLRSATIIPLIMVIGHVLEDRSMIGSKEAINALAKLTENSVTKINTENIEETVSAKDLAPGDLIIVRPGERISADGILVYGKTSLDTAPLTGESVPVEVKKGDIVRAGSINLYGLVKIEVSQVGDKTALGQIVELLKEAEQSKPPVTRVLEEHAGTYLPLTIAISLITLFITGDVASMMAVLVVCCPCALAISAPATTVAGLAAAGRHGILIKGTAFLEQLAEADTMIFDKTGTLTTGRLNIVDIKVYNGHTKEEVQNAAASLAVFSKHPVSNSIARASGSENLKTIEDLSEIQGFGLKGKINGTQVILGRASLLAQYNIKAEIRPKHFGPLVACSIGNSFAGWILLQDTLRPEAESVLNNLKNLGIKRTLLVSGDNEAATKAVSDLLPLDETHWEKLPHEKLSIIKKEIKNKNRPVMVGDGINDALALKAGAVGIAIGGSGTDIALASSDIVLLTPDLRRIETMIRLSRKCRSTITANIVIAMTWTLIMFVCAAGGFIGPVAASLFHNIGTVFVIANSGRLLAFNEISLA
ncbi:MAG: cadmium-translocating P-type ATPase [Desulfobacteraceae bacterium]|nr:cadmium-translocating P-type ATPase [Desulfobacteraceae bacterium]